LLSTSQKILKDKKMAYSISIKIEGTDFSEVNEKVDKYFQQYNPCGYGTSIERTEYNHKNGELVKTVTISRYSSCD
jgi:hypothetical protein